MRWSRQGALILILMGACRGDVCGCPPVDTSAHAEVRGLVRNATGEAVVGTEIGVAGLVDRCSVSTSAFSSRPATVVSGPRGEFALRVWTVVGAGEHCLDFLIHDPATGFLDTVRRRIGFVGMLEVADTIELDVTIPDLGGDR